MQQLADPEWVDAMGIYMEHLENLNHVASSGQKAVVLHEAGDSVKFAGTRQRAGTRPAPTGLGHIIINHDTRIYQRRQTTRLGAISPEIMGLLSYQPIQPLKHARRLIIMI